MKLFISYARDDKQWVYDLDREFKEWLPYTVWLDRDLSLGQPWWNEILKQIEECDCFMPILTPAYVNSAYCIAELEYAAELAKPLAPLLMKRCDLPSQLKSIQYDDIEGRPMVKVVLTCLVALRNVELDIRDGKYPAPTDKPVRPPLPDQSKKDSPDGGQFSVDDKNYRQWLQERTYAIDIRGIGVGNIRQAYRFPLLSLYIKLHASGRGMQAEALRGMPLNRVPLEEVVTSQRHTIVVGDPGSGKTTFLNYALC
jgi:TIR domain